MCQAQQTLPVLQTYRSEGLGFRVWGLGFRVYGFGLHTQHTRPEPALNPKLEIQNPKLESLSPKP